MAFTHLHVHSQYSLLDGMSRISDLVDKAMADGMPGIALTDHGNMFGIKEFYNYVKKVNGKLPEGTPKFKPILGCEMYVAKDKLTDRGDKRDNGYHLIVLAKNLQGYRNLIKLVSQAWTDGYYFKPRTDREQLEMHREGLIVCSACLGGELPQFIMDGELEKAKERAAWYKQTFGDDYYLELQRHETNKINASRDVYERQKEVNAELIKIARELDIKLIATNDVHFVREADAEAHDRLICVSTGKKFTEPERLHYTKQEWLKSPDEMSAIFADIPEALTNTQEIIDKVEIYSIDHGPIMPTFEIPEEFGTEDGYRSKYTEEDLFNEFTRDENGNEVLSKEEADKKIERLGGYDRLYRIKLEADYLKKLTMEGAAKRYGDPLPDEVSERLNFELYIMKTMGFPGYFLIVQDFINTGRDKLGVSIGPGRGSAAGSAAAYCLGITQIDPIKYDLLFERFLNPDRISLPDIDVDFDDDGRYAVLKYVTDKYGAEKVSHIITYGTMAAKLAIKDMAKVMDLPLAESNRLAKLVPDRMPEIGGKTPAPTVANCAKYVAEFKAETQNPNPIVREVLNYAEQLEGTVRNTGVHACGVIIGRDDITDWVPVSTATDSDGSKVLVTQYEGSVIEETGMIKMDFLGLKTLSIIMEAVENIRQTRGETIDMENIPLDDEATFRLYCEGRTTGTFQFESPGMQKHLRELQPSRFEDLIAMNALYRPGPMAYIPQFIARKHGREPIVYDIPEMEKYLHDTYGITVYQEQVMLLSRLLADFTRGESDMLRKAMGKKLIDKMQSLKTKFLAGGQANGHKPEVLEKIWGDWEEFAKYAFNKSHATCYSWVAYQTAYLKANYPAEYMAGVLSRNLTNKDKLVKFMDECKAMGCAVKGPDINESREKFSVNKNGDIRFGLGAIKGINSMAVKAIVDERDANGPYADIYDLVERVPSQVCNRNCLESLALSGALDCFGGMERNVVLEPMFDTTFSDILYKYGQLYQQDKNSIQASLFDDIEPLETARPPMPKCEPWPDVRRLDEEKKLVGLYLSAHPLDRFYMEVKHGCNTPCSELRNALPGPHPITFAGIVTGFQEKISRKGSTYGILTIEDYTGSADIHLFGKKYVEYKHFGIPGLPVFIRAHVEQSRFNPERADLVIEQVSLLEEMSGKLIHSLTLYMDADNNDMVLFDRIGEIQDSNATAGNLTVVFPDYESGRQVKVRLRKPVPFCRELMETLDDFGVSYKVNE